MANEVMEVTRWTRTYNISLPVKVTEDLNKLGMTNTDLIWTMVSNSDVGEFGTLHCVKFRNKKTNEESEPIWGTWNDVYTDDTDLEMIELYKVENWGCVESDWGPEA